MTNTRAHHCRLNRRGALNTGHEGGDRTAENDGSSVAAEPSAGYRALCFTAGQMQVTEVQMKAKTALVLLLHALVIWLGCGLTVAVGRGVLGLETTLWLHAIIAPTLTVLVSLVYFNQFHAANPLGVAAFFVSFIIIMDATVVALVFEKSYAMFGSILGTWFPFLLIFVATYLTGILVRERTRPIQRAA